jgi:hypothetical protein
MVAAFGFLVAFIASVTATLLQVIKVRIRPEPTPPWPVEPMRADSAEKSQPILSAARQ